MHIAFDVSLNEKQWTAGTIYYQNLLMALKSLNENPIKISIIATRESIGYVNETFRKYTDDIILIEIPSPSRLLSRQWKKLSQYLRVKDDSANILSKRLQENDVDVVFSRKSYGHNFAFPLMTWIPDFQHLHLPEMFDKAELIKRTKFYSNISQQSDVIILSSKSTLTDFVNFKPEVQNKGRVVSFLAQIPQGVYEQDPVWVCDYYHLPNKFFYLPNQFWKHKNHKIILNALKILHDQFPDIVVVCSGNLNDYRNPSYFEELLYEIAVNDLRNQMIILGVIPRDHVYSLIRQSIALLQPSMFEGWSTSVEEAKSLGKKIILSDIPVHHEQVKDGVFFDLRSTEDLKKQLIEAFKNWNAGPDFDLERQSKSQIEQRTINFAKTFIATAEQAIVNKQKRA